MPLTYVSPRGEQPSRASKRCGLSSSQDSSWSAASNRRCTVRLTDYSQRVIQNTHWYKSAHSQGWTSQVQYAAPGEVERIGIHDCSFLACPFPHHEGYPLLGIQAEVARQTADCDSRSSRSKSATEPRRLRTNEVRKAKSPRKMGSRSV